MTQGMYLAKALYDNVAEAVDELGFRKGDVLTILEQDTNGIVGWWLCSLRGKQGIAPGNRLKIISGVGEVSSVDGNNKVIPNLHDKPANGQQDYDVPPPSRSSYSRRPSYDALRNFVGPRQASLGDTLYDTPTSSRRVSAESGSGVYDTPPSSKRASSERTPPHSNRSSASRDSGFTFQSPTLQNQLSLNLQSPSTDSFGLPTVVRLRSNSRCSDKCSESNPGSNRSSLDRVLSEEGPPIYESLSPATSNEHLANEDSVYDTPPSRNQAQNKHVSKTRLLSAASNDSLLSIASSISSGNMLHAPSLPDSARSSMDLPSDIYDIPSRTTQGSDRSRKQLSMDSGLGFYDSPIRSRPSSSTSNNVNLETLKSSHSSIDCKSDPPPPKDIKRSKSLENAVDDVYDTPRNNAPKVGQKKIGGIPISTSSNNLRETASGLYDIPPQVTRDSVISLRSDTSDDSLRLSSSSFDNEQQMAEVLQWEELLLDYDSALELLLKRQQDVLKATSRLTSFINNNWRTRPSLEKTLYDIKMSCTLIRNSLLDFVDYSHGAIANAVKLPDYQLASKLQKYVSPLHNTLELVNKSFVSLEEMKWQVVLLSEPLDKSRPDYLGQIALVAKELMPEVKKVASYIQSNGSTLFRKAAAVDVKTSSMSSKPPVVPKASETNGGKSLNGGKPKTLQCRPLPSVPNRDRFLQELLPSADIRKLSLYDIKAALHKDDYAECDELSPEPEAEKLEVQEKRCIDEYDYVLLDSKKKSTKPHNIFAVENNNATDQPQHSPISKTESNEAIIKNNTKSKSVDFSEINEELIQAKEINVDNFDSNNKSNCVSNKLSVHGGNADVDQSEQEFNTPVNLSNSFNSPDFTFETSGSKVETKSAEVLDPNDRQVLAYYTEQINSHSTLLATAIDVFIGAVSSKEPPNIFISHSKFVIVSAHKLVHIGDTIHRNLLSNEISMKIMQVANHLCDCLKATVMATKVAALQYPSAPAVQEMVDRVIAVSHAAHELKLVITQTSRQ